MANNTPRIFANTIPAPYGARMEEAVKAGIGDLPGQWMVMLMADQKSLDYYVVLRDGNGPAWQWKFDGPYEQQSEVVKAWIWNGLRGTIAKNLKEKREDILRIASRYGASEVKVFGSRARGGGQPHSDLDILVNPGPRTSLLDIVAMQHELEDLLGCKVDLVTSDALRPRLKDKVLKQAVNL